MTTGRFFTPGGEFGTCQIVKEIGERAMAAAWRAADPVASNASRDAALDVRGAW